MENVETSLLGVFPSFTSGVYPQTLRVYSVLIYLPPLLRSGAFPHHRPVRDL